MLDLAGIFAAALARAQGPDESRANEIFITEIILFVLATMAIIARLYVRLYVKPRLWLDDWTMFAAYAWTIFGFVTIILQVHYGLGRHSGYIGEDNTTRAIKWNQLARLTFIPTTALIKTSICFFMLRILDRRAHPHFRVYIWLVMAASIVANVVLLVVWSIQCIPLEAVWNPDVKGNCMSPTIVVDVAYVQAAFNLVTDILCALFPMFFFRTSYMRWRTRSALITLVALGILTSVTAALRVIYLNELAILEDATWELTNVTICALIETKAGIFLTCLPAVKCLGGMFLECLPFRLGGGKRKNSKEWDLMESPILPSSIPPTSTNNLTAIDPQEHNGFRQHLDLRNAAVMPLRPLALSRVRSQERDSPYHRGFDSPPGTPGLQEPMVKVTTWI